MMQRKLNGKFINLKLRIFEEFVVRISESLYIIQ